MVTTTAAATTRIPPLPKEKAARVLSIFRRKRLYPPEFLEDLEKHLPLLDDAQGGDGTPPTPLDPPDPTSEHPDINDLGISSPPGAQYGSRSGSVDVAQLGPDPSYPRDPPNPPIGPVVIAPPKPWVPPASVPSL